MFKIWNAHDFNKLRQSKIIENSWKALEKSEKTSGIRLETINGYSKTPYNAMGTLLKASWELFGSL